MTTVRWHASGVDVLRTNLFRFGIEATDDTIIGAWEQHSPAHSAGRLTPYDGAVDNVRALAPYLDFED